MADRTVYFAKISRSPQTGAFDRTFAEDILDALDPQHAVTRYRRTWRFSRPRVDGSDILGKLGFVRSAHASETRYDEELEDFVTSDSTASEGSFSMFVIDTEREILTFEERPPAIRRQSFLGNFSAILQQAGFRSSVTLLRDPTDFREFVDSVDRIEKIRAVVFEPNPGWREDARNLQAIIEQSNAQRAEVTAVAAAGESLNAEADWIEGALGQAAEHGKGTLKATGFRNGQKHVWTFGTRLQIAVISGDDAGTPEGVWDWMRRRLRGLFHE